MNKNAGKGKAKHAKKASNKPEKSAKKENIFKRLKNWFLSMSKGKRAVVITLTSILLVLTIAFGTLLGIFLDITKDYNYKGIDDEEINSIVPINEGIINIALFGVDARKVGVFEGLSDSIMILSLNTDTGKINVISIMRDTLVEIPGMKVNKINSAYNAGGPTLAIKTLNHNFGLDIKEYATVNFYGMEDIINAVGGIEVDVQKQELNGVGGLNASINEQAIYRKVKPQYVEKAGLQTLNGMQAVAWARIRKAATADGVRDDFGRTDRQRFVMEQLLNKALSMSLSEYPNFIKSLLPHMETSLSYDEIFKLAGIFKKDITFEQTRIPQYSYVMTGPTIKRVGSYVYYNLDFASDIIYSLIYDGVSQDDYIAQNGVNMVPWYDAPASNPSSGSGTSSGGNTGSSGSQSSTSSGDTSSSSSESGSSGETSGGDEEDSSGSGSQTGGSQTGGSSGEGEGSPGGEGETGGEGSGEGETGGGNGEEPPEDEETTE